MAEKPDNKETMSFEELLMSNTLEQEALISLLLKKGIITRQEMMEEIRNLTQA